jgi:hypothetical protein
MPGTRGRSGRKPVLTPLKLLHGNPGRRPLNDDKDDPMEQLLRKMEGRTPR